MKKSGLAFTEHYELGRNLRQIRGQARSIENVLATKFGETKRFTKQAERIGVCIDKITDDLKLIVKNMKDVPPDVDNYYYKV